jgi:hypothetical protein
VLRRDWFAALAVGGAIAVALLLYALLRQDPSPPAPRSLQEIARIADSLGLHHRSDIASGAIINRLIISDRPVSFVRANAVHIGDPHRPCWHGTVAACGDGPSFSYLIDGKHGVLWGEFLLYGDPALIRQLMTAPAQMDEQDA